MRGGGGKGRGRGGKEWGGGVAGGSLWRRRLELMLQEGQGIGSGNGAAEHALGSAFTGVGIKTNDLHERRIQREVDPRLNHGGTRYPLGFHVLYGLGRAEIREKSRQRLQPHSRRDHAIVVAGDSEDRAVDVTGGIV